MTKNDKGIPIIMQRKENFEVIFLWENLSQEIFITIYYQKTSTLFHKYTLFIINRYYLFCKDDVLSEDFKTHRESKYETLHTHSSPVTISKLYYFVYM